MRCDMNHDQGIFILQSPITRMRTNKLQHALVTYIQAMMSSSKKTLETFSTWDAKLSFKIKMY